MPEETIEAYAGWAIVELFGHKRLAGRVSQAEQYGQAMLRLDVPREDGAETTHFYGGASLYGVHPTSEEVARCVAARCDPSPVQRWELTALPAPSTDERCGLCGEPGPCYCTDRAEDDEPDDYSYQGESDDDESF